MLNNFTLSFNDGSVGKIKHQFIEMQPSSEINKKQDSSRIYYQKEEYSYGNPYAKEIVDEDSRESLKNIVNCLNETTKNN